LVFVVVIALAPSAHANPGPPPLPEPAADMTEASTLFDRARDLVKAGRFAEACPLFDRSYALEPALGTAINLADCLERAGQLRRAWELFDLVAQKSPPTQSRAQLARDRAAAIDAKLGHVTIHIAAPQAAGLTVHIDDRALAPAPELTERVDPGDATVTARVPGQPTFEARVHAAAGAPATVDIPAFAAPPPPIAPAETETRRRRSRVYLAGGLAAAGVASLATSLGLGLSARSTYNAAFDHHDCTDLGHTAACSPAGRAAIDRAGSRADLATGFAAAAAALVTAGAVVFFTAPTETIRIAPIARADTIGLGMTGRF
jgi:hypothetical protein